MEHRFYFSSNESDDALSEMKESAPAVPITKTPPPSLKKPAGVRTNSVQRLQEREELEHEMRMKIYELELKNLEVKNEYLLLKLQKEKLNKN